MKILIVYAHHEPKSFNAALLERSLKTLSRLGHEVKVSDLHAMNFNPVAGKDDFKARRFPDALQYDREQKYAHTHDAFADDIQAELDKLVWCDFLILQFPLWWFSVPAIMKGWIDRVFVNGVVYGTGRRMDAGGLKGRKAMMTITTGCYPEMVGPDGLLGDLDVNLWHLNSGTLAYAGFKVLAPFTAWSIHYTDHERRTRYLEEYAVRLEQLETAEPMFFHPLADFGSDWRLKPDVAPRTVGQHKKDSLCE
ncbi:MAG: NAD(P)H-dependent oxidoreductase [Sulfuricaulis sp.]|nr:NAD(P)H-dependent oxidoreductase [Sulfuricaulis sp.]